MRITPLSFSYANPLLERLGPDYFKAIPRAPGVYFMHHEDGTILYIGKAKDLRARLSWYKNAKPGAAAELTLELLESVARIRWEEHPSEGEAILRENELLHAVRPPFNVADAWPQAYLYIGIRAEAIPTRPDRVRLHFQLTSRRELARGYRVFGCFKHRRRTKMGYTALLRLLHAGSSEGTRRFSFPARITRSAPPYIHSAEASRELIGPLERFLAGRDLGLLRRIVGRMLANESIPRFMHPSLQDDFNTAQEFFRMGPRATRELKRRHGLKARVVSHRRMEQLLRQSCAETERPEQVEGSAEAGIGGGAERASG